MAGEDSDVGQFGNAVERLETGSEEYTFAQLADVQIGMMRAMGNVQWLIKYRALFQLMSLCQESGKKQIPIPTVRSDNKALKGRPLYEEQVRTELELSERAVRILNNIQPRPKFAIVCGDLTHSFPKADGSTGELYEEEVAAFKRIWKELDEEIRLVCVCGNHDVGEAPTAATIGNFKKRFGRDYFAFDVNNDRMVVMNSQYYKNGSACDELAREHDKWFTEELLNKPETRRHTIVFSHIPPFILDQDEPTAYFNLEKEVREELLKKTFEADVTHWFCGHYHRNVVSTARQGDKQLELVITGAVGGNITDDPRGDPLGLTGMGDIIATPDLSGFRVVSVSNEGIRHKFATINEFEAAA